MAGTGFIGGSVRVDLRLLGPFTVTVAAEQGDRPVTVGPRQQRLVLAVLAWEANRLVPVERLVEWLWPDEPPKRATHAIRVHVSNLRAALTEAGIEASQLALVTQGPGYLLRIDPERVDVHRFQRLIGAARSAPDDEAEVALLEEALALWRGPALVDTATPEVAERLSARLVEARELAMEDRFDALLRLGRGTELLGELAGAVDEAPSRERLVGQWVLALYRSGQRDRALAEFRRTRALLADELGVDPGPELRELELAILRDDPALRVPSPAQARAQRPVVPAMLPASVADFTGRTDQLAALDALLARPDRPMAVVISAISGTAGVGKTALAVRWAHAARERFPDGQLYVNLDGYAVGPPLRPDQVLAQFLRALGVPAERVPVEPAEAGGMYRTLLADRRMLVVLDNAADADQVRPLLPAGAGCFVLVTSRQRLDGLIAMDAARRITLDVLDIGEAVALLGRIIGEDRILAEPQAAFELARADACLPLALRISAAQLIIEPDTSIADYLVQLRERGMLTGLAIADDERRAVRAAFDLSYAALKPDVRQAFRLLGLVPGPTVTAGSLAPMANCTLGQAESLLDQLAAAHLVEEGAPGRFGCHDLLREYARETALETDPAQARETALASLFDHYLWTALAAVERLFPANARVLESSGDSDAFPDNDSAITWLHAERPNLVAAIRYTARAGPKRIAWKLCDTLRGYFGNCGFYVDWFIAVRAALAATDPAAEPLAHASARFGLAHAHMNRNQYAEAIVNYHEALALYRRSGWVRGEAATHINLGFVDEELGRLKSAAEHQSKALELMTAIGSTQGEAITLGNLGTLSLARGDLAAAVDYYERSRAIHAADGSEVGVADALRHLGLLAHLRGRYADAERDLRSSADLFARVSSPGDETTALVRLSGVLVSTGRLDEATRVASHAVERAALYPNRRLDARARNALGRANGAAGRARDAIEQYELALVLAEEFGLREEQCAALLGLAASRIALGARAAGVATAEQALELARSRGYQLLEGEALALLVEAVG
ncbi:MAG TPA: BTAD domain-containing putative transcriptional regulator [Pseudonocardiaceae bacterium]|jgi:DNA-binding SARP family transcriptional activator/tetratricopeptide (TPR) repeat protein|nr:BTAD domain-containing putative transcriptional regulator [Pseudonocardiaceae bacterium]